MSAPVSYMSSWKFKLYSFEIGHHPLHIGIPKEHSHGIFWKESSDECIVSIKDSDHVKKVGLSCLFAHLHCIKVESDKYVNTHTTTSTSNAHIPAGTYSHLQDLHVLCTEMFLRHYGFHCNDSVVINRVNMFPLERVVLAAKSDSVFSWLKSQEFMTGLLLSVCEGLVLCRKGDVLLSPISELLVKDDTFTESRFFDTVVLDCEPQNQGLLTLKSEIIITHAINECCDNSDLELKDSVSNMASLSTCDSNDFVKVDQVGDELNLQISSDDDTLVVSETVPQFVDKTGVFHPCIMPQSFLNQGLCDTSLKDDGHVIGVTSKVLNEQRITNGSWVVIEKLHSSGDAEPMELTPHPQLQSKECIEYCSFNSEVLSSSDVNHGIKQKLVNVEDKRICEYPRYCSRRLVQVHAIEKHKLGETMKDKIVYMSPLLWFNFNVHPSQLVQEKAKARIKSLTADTLVDERVQLGVQPNDRYPSHAKEVHIAIVESPEYSPKADYTSVLQAYFVEHRLLSEGDIFCISLKQTESIQQAEDTRSTRSPAVYFKVMKLLPLSDTPYQPAALVDIQHTSLFQAGTVQSFVPMLMKTYLTGEGSDVMWDWPMPAGLVQYSQQLMNAILPHLHNRCECREVAPTIVVTGPRGVGKNTVVKAVAKQLNMHIYQLNCYELHGETSASSEAKMKNVLNRAQLYAPCILLLRNIHIISKDREGTSDDPRVMGSIVEMLSSFQSLRLSHPVIIVGTTSDPRHMPAEFFSAFLHEVVIKVPSEAERADILHALLAMRTICHENVSVLHLAQRTAGMVLGDLCALVAQTNRAAYRRVLSACTHQHTQLTEAEEESIRLAGVSVRAVDFEMALDQLQAAHADVIGAPKIPNVTWEDVGGLTDAKTAILDTIQLPLRQPELFAAGMRRSGLLLYGPPGTGKTLLAKAVATECSLNFLSVKGPELINMYVGQSEENVREVFSRARTAAPSVIFFDELDSLAPNRGRSGDSGGVSDRVVSQLLAELDGLVKTSSVFVIAATNRQDLLDPALLRPGRFDKLVYVGVSRDKADQLKILTALTRKFNFSEDVDIREIVDDCPANLTGADFYALCSDSMLHAITRNMDELERGTLKEEDIQVTVNQSDFRIALRNLVPSVSENELARYQDLDTHFNL